MLLYLTGEQNTNEKNISKPIRNRSRTNTAYAFYPITRVKYYLIGHKLMYNRHRYNNNKKATIFQLHLHLT